jgi:DNA (cytosine-5)-methyltransferase 1
MKLISLFTGAGGLDLGFEAAGFQTRVAVELDSDAAATLRRNRDWPVFESDVHLVASTELLAAAELSAGEADLLIGGPPCQPFSKSGYWARGDAKRLNDPRASTLEEYLRVLRDTQPAAFLLENVPGLAYRSKDEGLELLRATIGSINREVGTNYSFSVHLVNTAEYGIPQERVRVFIVGHRDGRVFRMPSPTHRLPPKGDSPGEDPLLDAREPWRTAWDAIGDLEDDDSPSLRLRGKWADLLPSVPEGANYLFHTDRGEGMPLFGWRRRYWSFLLKLAKRLPSWTLTAQPGSAIGPFHWKNRRLSAEELCRLQTFPRHYAVVGNQVSVQRQLGNAVPSAMAEILGLEVRRQFFGEPGTPLPTLLPERRAPVPDPEDTAEVLPKYWDLIGSHAPHPGTGKGRGALARSATAG